MNKYQKQISREVKDFLQYHDISYYKAKKYINWKAKLYKRSRMKVLCSNCCSYSCKSTTYRKMAYCSEWD